MQITFAEYPQWLIEQTLAKHMILLKESKDKQGCIRKPMISLEPTNCPPDLLHMKKGIISKLINQLVDWVVLQGKEENLMNEMKKHKIPFTYLCLKN